MLVQRFLGALGVVIGCTTSPIASTDPPAAAVDDADAATSRVHLAGPIQPPDQTKATTVDALRILALGMSAKDYATRLIATEALASVPSQIAIPALERQLADPDEDIRVAAVIALGKHPDPAATALLLSVRDDDKEQLSLRVIAASTLLIPPCR